MVLSRITIAALVATALASPAVAQGAFQAAPSGPVAGGQISPEALYQGWRSRQVIGGVVHRPNGDPVGTVRDLIIGADGRIAAIVVEGGGASGVPDVVYRIPWDQVGLTPGRDGVAVNLAGSRNDPRYRLFQGTAEVTTAPREYRLTEIIGDYARLQTGYGFGIVTDAVFGPEGHLIAILVSRDAASGGGTYAFPYPGTTGRWEPQASYYGLPYVTDRQAAAAGVRIEPQRFRNSSM
ncbi:PRC-barrel domain-containing protein [Microvirga roseola]|uniref:PRC-barrel domain-containing protein n=1 Tax=Microvirga roseola TaxID=2883126 RepID=UPI001E52EC81|nr:PRC-barrel domain-containing protein [Microvirga roseola]